MKKTFNVLLATAVIATQAWTQTTQASSLEEFVTKARDKVVEKIHNSNISVSANVLSLGFNIGDMIGLGTNTKYRYVLDPDSGKYLRQDIWEDALKLRTPIYNRDLKRHMTYGRYYSDWHQALSHMMFSPLDLRNISSQTLINSMRPGDMASMTFDQAVYKGPNVGGESGNLSGGFRAGQLVTGQLTAKILREKDNKVLISFANTDQKGTNVGFNIAFALIPGLLKIKIIDSDNNFSLRGNSALASYEYDLNNPRSREVLDKLLQAFDSVSILSDAQLRSEFIDLDDHLSAGLIDVTPSADASQDPNSGISPVSSAHNQIATGHQNSFRFLSGLYRYDGISTMNVLNINSMEGINPGQYLVAYISKNYNEARSSIRTMNSAIYKPAPTLTNTAQARGYRGLQDLVGITYHTEANHQSEVKEILTYAKLCNAGILACAAPMQANVVDRESDAGQRIVNRANPTSSMDSNYFISRGLFEKIKQRLNWGASSPDARRQAIRSSIEPLVREFLIDDFDRSTSFMTNFFYEVLDKSCYTNLVGIEANSNNAFKRFFGVGGCTTDLTDINNDVRINLRYNMVSFLLNLYDPQLLPALSTPMARANPAAIQELSQYFSVSYNTTYDLTSGATQVVNGLSFNMSGNSRTNQAMQLTSVIQNWQQVAGNNLTYSDKQKMLGQAQ